MAATTISQISAAALDILIPLPGDFQKIKQKLLYPDGALLRLYALNTTVLSFENFRTYQQLYASLSSDYDKIFNVSNKGLLVKINDVFYFVWNPTPHLKTYAYAIRADTVENGRAQRDGVTKWKTCFD